MIRDNAFWAKVDQGGGLSACWPWVGARWMGLYGQLTRDKHKIYAHRYAWEQTYGPIPTGLLVCHHCDNPPCCNPSHLFVGTDHDNHVDMVRKGRSASGDRSGSRRHPERLIRGEAHRNAKLTETTVREIRVRYALGGIRQRDLARQYRVTQTLIGLVVRRRIWTHIDSDLPASVYRESLSEHFAPTKPRIVVGHAHVDLSPLADAFTWECQCGWRSSAPRKRVAKDAWRLHRDAARQP